MFVKIIIKNDYYAYIERQQTGDKLFELIKKSYTRKEKQYNNFYHMYETVTKRFYSLINNGNVLKLKAGTIPYLCNSLYICRIKYELQDEREKLNIPVENLTYKLNDKIKLRKYQIDAVQAVYKSPFSVVQLPTGTGKTEVSAAIIKNYFHGYENKAFVYVVPVIKLQDEAKERFEQYGLQVNTKLPIQTGKVNILTYATLTRADNNKLDYQQRNSVGAIIWDEAHHLGADKASKIIHRFRYLNMCIGMSATPSNDTENKCFLKELNSKEFSVYGCTGKVCYRIDVSESIENSFVTPIEIRVLENKTRHYLGSDENDWHIIKDVVLKDVERAKLVAGYTKHIQKDANLDTIVLLIPETKWSRLYMQQVSNLYKNEKDVYIFELYGGNVIYEYINNEPVQIKNLNDKKNVYNLIRNPEIKTIFACTTFFFEGIDIKNLQALINVYGGRDTKRIKQQAGRVMRLFEDKDIAYIHEIKDINNPVLVSQFEKRMKIYTQEYNAKIIYSNFNKEG